MLLIVYENHARVICCIFIILLLISYSISNFDAINNEFEYYYCCSRSHVRKTIKNYILLGSNKKQNGIPEIYIRVLKNNKITSKISTNIYTICFSKID